MKFGSEGASYSRGYPVPRVTGLTEDEIQKIAAAAVKLVGRNLYLLSTGNQPPSVSPKKFLKVEYTGWGLRCNEDSDSVLSPWMAVHQGLVALGSGLSAGRYYFEDAFPPTSDAHLELGSYDSASSDADVFDFVNSGSGSLELRCEGNKVWHAGNDGSGSGLDADTVDGKNPTATPAASALPLADPSGTLDSWVSSFIPYGISWSYQSATTLRMSPSGLDSKARIALYDGSAWKNFTVTGNVDVAISLSGAGGLDTGAEAANTLYYVWHIGKSDGTYNLLLSVSSSGPTMPSGYTYKRLANVVFRNNSASDLFPFDCVGGVYRYRAVDVGNYPRVGIEVLTAGLATSATAIDLSGYVPSHARFASCHATVVNASATTRSCVLEDDNSTEFQNLRSHSGTDYNTVVFSPVLVPIRANPATAVYYWWDPSAATDGLYFGVLGFDFPYDG